MLYGVDLSNHNGLPAQYRGTQWYADAQFVIGQAIPRPAPNGYVADQLQAALDDGKHRGIYTWLWHDPTWRLNPDVAEDQRLRLATVPDHIPLDIRVFLDVEDNQSTGWRVPIQQRVDDVWAALEVLDQWSADRGLPQAGIYWSRYFIDLLFGGVDYFERMQWLAHYGITPGSLIGGNVVAHQYTSTPIDQNMMLESEIVVEEPVPEPDCDQGWTDKKAAVVATAGELLSVSDQMFAEANRKAGPRRIELRKLAQGVGERASSILR